MTPWSLGFAAAAAILLLAGAAQADDTGCAIPDDLALHDLTLPAARAAVATGKLTILTVGGAASAGQAAQGTEFTYPVRLAARLRAALPKLDVSVVSRSAARRTAATSVSRFDADLAQTGARLVIWAPGAIEAGSGTDIDALGNDIAAGIAKVHDAGADLVLIDLQYAPSIARVVNLQPYREVVERAGAHYDVPVLDRYELMRRWSADGVMDLDVTDAQGRVQMARRLFDCLAAAMADGIVEAVH